MTAAQGGSFEGLLVVLDPDAVLRADDDEFAVLLESVHGLDGALGVAEGIRSLFDSPFDLDGSDIVVGASIGIAMALGSHDAAELLRRADLAMYRVKEHGKDGTAFFDPAMEDQAVDRLDILSALRKAVERDELVVHYQPIVNLETGDVVAAEALMRWDRPGHGLVPPLDFIPFAEQSGLIQSIGAWILKEACARVAPARRPRRTGGRQRLRATADRSLLRTHRGRRPRRNRAGAALVLPPILAMSVEGDPTAVAVNLAYPAGDLLLLGLLVGALALTGWRPDRSITWLGIGVLLSAAADLSYLDAIAHGNTAAPTWALSLWPAAALVTAVAAWQPVVTVRPMRLEGRRLLVLPLAAMIAAVVLLFADHFFRISDLAAILAFATLLVAGVRLCLTLGEHMTLLGTSRDEATTDPLTGLGNRRALANDLAEQMVDASPQRPLLLLLFDLNGFKSYNDSYGHPAGDALLTRLGPALTRAVDGRGHAYRMGGDEFCVLAAAPADRHSEFARSRGRHSAKTGMASQSPPRSHRDDRRARQRLGPCPPRRRPAHVRREERPPRVGRQAERGRAAAGLTERHPGIGDHVDSVAALTEKVGRELAMSEQDRTTLRQAAALHDIGKAAVLDAILDKPGPSTMRSGPSCVATPDRGSHSGCRSCAHRRGSDRAFLTRTLRRRGISGSARRCRHPARRPHRRGLRRIRRNGHRPPVPTRVA